MYQMNPFDAKNQFIDRFDKCEIDIIQCTNFEDFKRIVQNANNVCIKIDIGSCFVHEFMFLNNMFIIHEYFLNYKLRVWTKSQDELLQFVKELFYIFQSTDNDHDKYMKIRDVWITFWKVCFEHLLWISESSRLRDNLSTSVPLPYFTIDILYIKK